MEIKVMKTWVMKLSKYSKIKSIIKFMWMLSQELAIKHFLKQKLTVKAINHFLNI